MWHLIGFGQWKDLAGYQWLGAKEVKVTVFLLSACLVVATVTGFLCLWSQHLLSDFLAQPWLQPSPAPSVFRPFYLPMRLRLLGTNDSGCCQSVSCWFALGLSALYWTIPLLILHH